MQRISGGSGPGSQNLWHAVSIVATNASCHMARALATTRFLSREAPPLPLPECGAGNSCPCTYKHHADRRAHPRRAEEVTGIRRPRLGPDERRRDRGRRSSDF